MVHLHSNSCADQQQRWRLCSFELFHGPTLAFKDGGRFMAQSLAVRYLMAEKSDSNSNIWRYRCCGCSCFLRHGRYQRRDSFIQRVKSAHFKRSCSVHLGKNIHTVAVNGDFDACQALVKSAFDDAELREKGLNSANSINISRLMAQICYYFEAAAQMSKAERENLVISVPSGNFGTLLLVYWLNSGFTIKRFIAATNANDTVPRYLETGKWDPNQQWRPTSNAMDVSQPNNWPVSKSYARSRLGLETLGKGAVSTRKC